MDKDILFQNPSFQTDHFAFDHHVAGVFEDMLNRSVPCYGMIQRLIVMLSTRFAVPNTALYDLGCSTGDTLFQIRKQCLAHPIHYVGLDNSLPMLEKAKVKFGDVSDVSFEHVGLESFDAFKPSCVVIGNLTLQFLPPETRLQVLSRVYQALLPGGVFIFFEKTCEEDPLFERLYTDVYESYKFSQGYSREEILRKKKALQGVLQPISRQGNQDLLHAAGFLTFQSVFQWMNFYGIMAVK